MNPRGVTVLLVIALASFGCGSADEQAATVEATGAAQKEVLRATVWKAYQLICWNVTATMMEDALTRAALFFLDRTEASYVPEEDRQEPPWVTRGTVRVDHVLHIDHPRRWSSDSRSRTATFSIVSQAVEERWCSDAHVEARKQRLLELAKAEHGPRKRAGADKDVRMDPSAIFADLRPVLEVDLPGAFEASRLALAASGSTRGLIACALSEQDSAPAYDIAYEEPLTRMPP